MKVLHITNWYRSIENPHKVPFIKEHFDALNLYAEGKIIHIEVQQSIDHFFKFTHEKISPTEESFILKTTLKKWFFIEWLSFFLLKYVLIKRNYKSYDVINVHTGYPLLTRLFNYSTFKKPALIIEHWTAFHYNFNLPKTTNKLDRIKKIYQQNIPLITVSDRLKKDIEEFCGYPQNSYILPNVVDSKYFFYTEKDNPNNTPIFFMLNYWRTIKSPFEIFDGFKAFLEHSPKAVLRVGGYGPLWTKMEEFVKKNQLEKNIILLGPLDKPTIGKEMRNATAFVHAADYETFSVVCAEAISCGCPVFVNQLDAVGEFIHSENGYLKPNSEKWIALFSKIDQFDFNRKSISEEAKSKFSQKVVGELYYKYNQEVISKYFV